MRKSTPTRRTVRLAKDPERLDRRLADLSRDLAAAQARETRATGLRSKLAAERAAVVKNLRVRVADLALSYLKADVRRLNGFKEWAGGQGQSALYAIFFEASEDAPREPTAVKKRRGRPKKATA